MTKATESELNTLHAVVARVLKNQLEKHETVTIDGEEVELDTVSPAMVAQAIKFLKDNSITTTAESDDNLNSLKETLENKQKKGRLLAVVPKQAAGEDQT